MYTLLLLLFLFLSVDGQMQFSVLRDRIQGDSQQTQELIDMSNAPPELLLEGVPYIDSEATWLIPLGNGSEGLLFEEINFDLATSASARYVISAVDIRNLIAEGSCDQPASQLAVITNMAVEISSPGPESFVNSSCYIEDEFLDLNRMGLSALNPVMRFSFPPIAGNRVSLFIEGTAPLSGQGQPVSVCLQADFRAANAPQGAPPNPPPPAPLLQYNMNAPTRLVEINQLFDDAGYTGLTRSLYTGGTGALTDGVIGTDPFSAPEAWVGFQEPDQAGLRLFFNQSYPVKEIRVYYWNDLVMGVSSPMGGVRNREGDRITQFSFSSQIVDASVASLSMYTGVINTPMELDYLELILRTPDQGLLLAEVSVLQEVAPGQLIDLVSGEKSLSPELGTSTAAATATTSSLPSPATPPLPPRPVGPEVLIIVYASMGIIGSLSIVIVCMCLLFLVIFLCMRSGAKRKRPHSPEPKHSSLMRQLSGLGAGDKTHYNKFEAGTDLYTEMDNIYQQVDRPLPLPPVPGDTAPPQHLSKDDSYIEMQQTGIGLRIDTGDRPQLKQMRTLSEDDYAPVTPPSVPVGSKEPPARLISDPYVAVTPPYNAQTGFKLTQEPIEEQYEAVTPPDSAGHTMATLGVSSIPNQYVSMAPAESQRDV